MFTTCNILCKGSAHEVIKCQVIPIHCIYRSDGSTWHMQYSAIDLVQKGGKMEGHYDNVLMGTIASQITSLMVVYWTVYSDTDQRKHQGSASLAFVGGNSPHKGPVTRKMFPFDDVIMSSPNINHNDGVVFYIYSLHNDVKSHESVQQFDC